MEKKLYDLVVNEKYEHLCPPLREAERRLLEESIITNGCETPLIVWKGTEIIVDGHNRYRICKAHGIPFAVEEKEFKDELEVLYWIVSNQLGRRNLTKYSKVEIILPFADQLREEAMRRMRLGHRVEEGSPEMGLGTGKTSDVIARFVGVSHGLVEMVIKIDKVADEETKEKLRSGDVAVTPTYNAIRRDEKKAAAQVPRDRECADAGRDSDDSPETQPAKPSGSNTLSPLLDKPIITDPLQTEHIDGRIAFNPVAPDDTGDDDESQDAEPWEEDGGAEEQVREMVDEFLEELNEVLETADPGDAGSILELLREMSDSAVAAVRDKLKETEE